MVNDATQVPAPERGVLSMYEYKHKATIWGVSPIMIHRQMPVFDF